MLSNMSSHALTHIGMIITRETDVIERNILSRVFTGFCVFQDFFCNFIDVA